MTDPERYPPEPTQPFVALEREGGDEMRQIEGHPPMTLTLDGERWTRVKGTHLVNGQWSVARYRLDNSIAP